jgi:hypothetical protein
VIDYVSIAKIARRAALLSLAALLWAMPALGA